VNGCTSVQVIADESGTLVSDSLAVLSTIKHIRVARGIRNLMESIFAQLKRRMANFAGASRKGAGEGEKMKLDLVQLLYPLPIFMLTASSPSTSHWLVLEKGSA